MVKFGGNTFINCQMPLAFAGRYFILEPDTSVLLVSVFLEREGKLVFEVLRNNPQHNAVTQVTQTPVGVLTVSDRNSGKFLYKVRPGSVTSVVFGTLEGKEIEATISDKAIQIGGICLTNNAFNGCEAGIGVDEKGRVGIGRQLPERIRQLLTAG